MYSIYGKKLSEKIVDNHTHIVQRLPILADGQFTNTKVHYRGMRFVGYYDVFLVFNSHYQLVSETKGANIFYKTPQKAK